MVIPVLRRDQVAASSGGAAQRGEKPAGRVTLVSFAAGAAAGRDPHRSRPSITFALVIVGRRRGDPVRENSLGVVRVPGRLPVVSDGRRRAARPCRAVPRGWTRAASAGTDNTGSEYRGDTESAPQKSAWCGIPAPAASRRGTSSTGSPGPTSRRTGNPAAASPVRGGMTAAASTTSATGRSRAASSSRAASREPPPALHPARPRLPGRLGQEQPDPPRLGVVGDLGVKPGDVVCDDYRVIFCCR
jgi:hypothetical protein